MLPSLQLLEKVSREIMSVPNRQKESKRGIHYGLFLLGCKSGLRISEAVKFDLENKIKHGLYRIEKPKGKKERFVYIPKSVIKELRKNNWQPNQTNRWNFYHFLRKIKRELNISESIELTPHTLRRAFTTYHAENGLPLPLLQKLLGHSSIRTTALYWRNTYRGDDDNISDILAGKNWLERPEPSQNREPPNSSITENFAPPKVDTFPEMPNSEPIFIANNSVIPKQKPTIKSNSLLTSREQEKNPVITNYQPKSVISKFPAQQKLFLNITNQRKEISEQLRLINNQKEPQNKKELILLQKVKQLEEQLSQTQTENNNLKALVKSERARADNYQQQLKTIAKTLYQLQKKKVLSETKINYYQQLEQEQKVQIEQPLPFKK